MVSASLKVIRVLAMTLAGLLATLLLLVIVINHPQGQRLMAQAVAKLSNQTVILTGLSGPFPRHLGLERIELGDADGIWLTVDRLQLDWDIPSLLSGKIRLHRLSAGHVAFARLPLPDAPPPPPPRLPLPIAATELAIGRLDLAAAVAGKDISLIVIGSGEFVALDQARANLLLQPLHSHDEYRLNGEITPAKVAITARIKESQYGLLAGLARLPQAYPMNLEARFLGPRSAIDSHLRLSFGPLTASAEGLLDWVNANNQLDITAQTPALPLVDGWSWQKANLSARLTGRLSQPIINGKLDLDDLKSAETKIGSIQLAVDSDQDGNRLTGTLAQITFARLPTNPLQNQPITLSAHFYPSKPNQPLDFKLEHSVFKASGNILTHAPARAHLTVKWVDLQTFAALAGLNLQGDAVFQIDGHQLGTTTNIAGKGTINLSAGDEKVLALLGKQAQLSLKARLDKSASELDSFDLKGKNLVLHSQGKISKQSLVGEYHLTVMDLTALAQSLTGKLVVQGQLSGHPENFMLSSNLSGELGFEAGGQRHPEKPVTGKLQLNNLPNAPNGEFDGRFWLAGSPLNMSVNANKQKADVVVGIQQAHWKSAQLQGQLTLSPKAPFPLGKITFNIAQLADFQPIIGQPLTGGMNGEVTALLAKGQPRLDLVAHARQVKIHDQLAMDQISLAATLNDPLRSLQLDGKLSVDGLTRDALGGKLQLDFVGPPSALTLQLHAALMDPANHPIAIEASAQANAEARRLLINRSQVSWRKETLALREPLTIRFADGLKLDNLRLGLRQATLAIDGQISPLLDLNAHLKDLPAGLISALNPRLNMTGTLQANARLTGAPHRPQGKIEINATDITLKHQQLSLPAAQIKATALLDGTRMELTGQAKVNTKASAHINGSIPFDPSLPLQLHANADIDLKLSDPILTAAGRRLRGQAKFQADVAGTIAQPSYRATLQLDKADALDHTLGFNITDINALIQAENGIIRINKFAAKAGAGQINAQGSINLDSVAMPMDVKITSRNARILASDRLMVNLDSDLALRGDAGGKLLALGSISINRAEIRIPERLPVQIAVLNIPSAATAQKETKPTDKTGLGLNLVISAPGNILVRGQGLDAELYGTVRITGSPDQPQPDGVFKLRRGTFTIVGKTLAFSEGAVSFDGGSLTNPSLDFTASSTSNHITAILNVGGTANKPIIRLSSVPSLPQDEVLARLLFDRDAANLSVTEMVQIGRALASLTGVHFGLDDPLENVRTRLGLDRLSVGATLEAGRYVMPGVYLGATQGLTGSDPQATIQIDLTKQLKLEATVGGGTSPNIATPNTNRVGIIFQHEY